ncbi:unnamed protein product [Mytilus edulis]|uniref:Endonuclease/exonuclease/phosphatase domain-containing protein n=1 Tax=Mytilus edulis TaxID=6550 RepID=A0A8S3UEC6_MYTED|nr:unnamed protein product [Mytilus edulis]
MDEHCLSTKDIGKTFISANGSDCTAIDYILFQETFKESIINIKNCEFTGNVSDHYPLLLSLDFEITKSSNTKTEFNPKMKVKWDKADLSKYTEIINEGLITSLQDINTKVDIETGFHDITAVIAKATNEIAQKPKTRKNKPKLKVMSDEILKAIRNKKSAFYYWKAKGRPTDSLDPFLLEKKITTQELRKICRLEVAQKRIQERNEIIEARSSNKTLFYKLINKQRGKLSRRIDELNVGDNIYNTPEQIMEGWKIHFGQLAENTLDENFDSNYLKTTENEYKNIIELCSEQFIHVDGMNYHKETMTYIQQQSGTLSGNNKVTLAGVVCDIIPGQCQDASNLDGQTELYKKRPTAPPTSDINWAFWKEKSCRGLKLDVINIKESDFE